MSTARPERARPAGVVIFGTGDIGQLAHFYLTHDSVHEVVAFTADAAHVATDTVLGLPVVPFEEVETRFPPGDFAMFVALSYRRLNRLRVEKYEAAKAKGYRLVSYVCSRSVTWSDLSIGDNCFIFENQTIQPYVTIGNNVTMWSGNHIGHHSVIGDHVFVTSHACVAGHVTVEPCAFLGVNCTIRDGVRIGRGSVIGAGAVIVKDTVADGVYTGTAAELRSPPAASIGYFTR
jgi:sugar O-acyltransferase (sialic acid O-acetyltransferase NeuD family)